MIDLFETAMNTAGKVDDLLGKRGARAGGLILLATLFIVYLIAPSPYDPTMPYPPDNITGIGLQPPLWWAGGAPPTPLLERVGLDPNAHINYEIFLGDGENNLTTVAKVIGETHQCAYNYNLTWSLHPSTTYYWQVRASNRLHKKSESPLWKFSTQSVPTIETFKADRTLINRGEPVQLRWSIINVSRTNLDPLGEVPPLGEAIFYPQKNTSYTLTASNFAGDAQSKLWITVVTPQIIDFMEGGWSTYEEGYGSRIYEIKSVEGKFDNATKISYDLIEGGRVGITKNVTNQVKFLENTDGISYFYKGGGTPNKIQLVLIDQDGISFGTSWEMATVPESWTTQEAMYEDFRCLEADGCKKDLNPTEIAMVGFGIYDEEGRESGSSGWIIIDDVQAFHRS